MDENEFQKYLKERYENQIEWYEKKSQKNKMRYMILQFSLIIFSALTPVLIVIDYLFDPYSEFGWISISMSIITAILASTLKTFKFQEKWVNFRSTNEFLKKEIHLYRASAGSYAKVADKKAIFVERVEKFISQEHTSWAEEYKFMGIPDS